MHAKPIVRGDKTPQGRLGSDFLHLPVPQVPERQWQTALNTLKIRNTIIGTAQPAPPALIRRCQGTRALIEQHGVPVRFLGYAPLFNGSLLYPASNCDWAIMNIPDDPFYRSHERRLYAPSSVKQDLTRYLEIGLSFDAVFIAHEIPKNSVKPGQEIPFDLIVPPPPTDVQHRLSFLEKSSLWFWQVIAKVIRSSSDVTVRTASHLSAGLAALAARDPILFGVQFDANWQVNGRPIGMWYYLTHWFWAPGEKWE